MKSFHILNVLVWGVLPSAQAAPTAQGDLQCGVYGDGSDFYTSSTVKSVEECMATCEKDAKCLASEYKPSNGKCWLYSKPVSQAKTKEGKDWIFNDKGCSA